MTHILTSHTAKQFIGACTGMAIAALVYIGLGQISDSSIKGLLVSTKTITVSTGSAINAKDVNDATLRRLATRAQTVATTLQKESVETQAETPLTNFASSRRAVRQFAIELKELASNAKTYSNDPNVVMTEKDRLAIRAARVGGASTADALASKSASSRAQTSPTSTTVTAQPDAVHPGASEPQTTTHSTNLPNSGLGLNLFVLFALAAAFLMSDTTWKKRLSSMIHGLRIG